LRPRRHRSRNSNSNSNNCDIPRMISFAAAVLLLLLLLVHAPRNAASFELKFEFGLGPSSSCSGIGSASRKNWKQSTLSSGFSARTPSFSSRPESIPGLMASNNDNENEIKNETDDFPFSPDELVAMARDYTSNPTTDWWDEDFVFRGPVIGPLCKKDLVDTLTANLDLQTAFPDLQENAFGFSCDDPIDPHRVWYFHRPRGTFSGPFNHPTRGILPPTNAKYIGPPEVRSVTFSSSGKIRYQTVGYVADRFTGDTTGGRGAVFGLYAVMGEEIDPNPGSWSTMFLQKLGEYLPESVPQSYSKDEDLPAWWTDERRGAEP